MLILTASNHVKNFCKPLKNSQLLKCLIDIRAWFGLIDQVSFYESLTEEMKLFKELLKPSKKFYLDNHLQYLFNKSKEKIMDLIKEGITIFDKELTTCLQTDFSKYGLGFLLWQKHCNCEKITPICCPTDWKVTLTNGRSNFLG